MQSARTPPISTCGASVAARSRPRPRRSKPTCSTRPARFAPSWNARGGRLWHVKPHGALYNQAVKNENLARAIARGVRRLGGGVTLVGLANSEVFRAAARIGNCLRG